MSGAREQHPRFRGYVCIVKGCTRVEYKHELCRKHWDEVPWSEKIGIMSDVIDAAMRASRSHDPKIRKWARHYELGIQAAQSKRPI